FAEFAHHVLAVIAGAVGGYLAYVGMDPNTEVKKLLIASAVGVVAALSFWKAPDALFGRLLRRGRDRAFVTVISLFGLYEEVRRFRIDWVTKQARPLEAETTPTNSGSLGRGD